MYGVLYGLGSIDIFVKPFDIDFFEEVRYVLENEEPAVTVAVVRGPKELLGHQLLIRDDGHVTGALGNEWDGKVLTLAQESLSQGISRRIELNEDIEVFIEAAPGISLFPSIAFDLDTAIGIRFYLF